VKGARGGGVGDHFGGPRRLLGAARRAVRQVSQSLLRVPCL
jgi:hypothetical protein